jgi:hypothetical protein
MALLAYDFQRPPMPGLLLGSEQRRRLDQRPPPLGRGTTAVRICRLRCRSAARSGLPPPPLGSSPLSRNLSSSMVMLFEGTRMSLSALAARETMPLSARTRRAPVPEPPHGTFRIQERGQPPPASHTHARSTMPAAQLLWAQGEKMMRKMSERRETKPRRGGASSGTRRRSRQHLAPELEGDGIACGEREHIGAGDDARAHGLQHRLGHVHHVEPAQRMRERTREIEWT